MGRGTGQGKRIIAGSAARADSLPAQIASASIISNEPCFQCFGTSPNPNCSSCHGKGNVLTSKPGISEQQLFTPLSAAVLSELMSPRDSSSALVI